MLRIAIVLSASTRMSLTDGATRAIGFWPEELVEPVRAFAAAGAEITMATPAGRPAVPDPAGLSPEGTGLTPERCAELGHAVASLQDRLHAPQALNRIEASDFDAVFVPGGYAPMADLWADPSCGTFLTGFHQGHKPIAAVCHGPAALLGCMTSVGDWPFTGYRMTAFTDAEERDVALLDTLPWTAQQALEKRGARFSAQSPWSEHVVTDRHLLTGQNPASAAPLAHRLLEALGDAPRTWNADWPPR